MAMTEEMALKANITAMLVVHGYTVNSDDGNVTKRAVTPQQAANLAVEIIETSNRMYRRR